MLAEVDGPWAVDLAHDGAENIAGKGDPGVMAVPVAVLANQNQNGNKAFATDGTRYAFGFDVVTAQSGVYNVNLDAAAQADYAEMVSNQCAVLYVGTATFKGGTVPGYESCNAGHTAADGWPAPNTPVTFPPVLQVADDLRQLPERRLVGPRRCPARIPSEASPVVLAVHARSNHHPHRPPVLGQRPS